jgi:hypothetical protein
LAVARASQSGNFVMARMRNAIALALNSEWIKEFFLAAAADPDCRFIVERDHDEAPKSGHGVEGR